jgi:hypothetical protein
MKYILKCLSVNICLIRLLFKMKETFLPLPSKFALEYAIRKVHENKEGLAVHHLRHLLMMGGVIHVLNICIYKTPVSDATFIFLSSLHVHSSYVYITTCFDSFAIIRYLFLPKLLHCTSIPISYMPAVGCHLVKINLTI